MLHLHVGGPADPFSPQAGFGGDETVSGMAMGGAAMRLLSMRDGGGVKELVRPYERHAGASCGLLIDLQITDKERLLGSDVHCLHDVEQHAGVWLSAGTPRIWRAHAHVNDSAWRDKADGLDKCRFDELVGHLLGQITQCHSALIGRDPEE
jgi:hypothetical protein